MDEKASALVDAALELSITERAKIVAALVDSFDGPTDPDAKEAWAAEIARRVAELKTGTVTGLTWEEVKSRARQARGR